LTRDENALCVDGLANKKIKDIKQISNLKLKYCKKRNTIVGKLIYILID